MSKEMIVSSSSHEAKIAILEDDQLAELYFERGNEYSLAGSIYKGKVTRVLPGMQSAFVDIGLERDAFLYVSDFFEETEEYDKIASRVEEKVPKIAESREEESRAGKSSVSESPAGGEAKSEPAAAPFVGTRSSTDSTLEKGPPPAEPSRHFAHRSRRRRSRRKEFPDSKYASHAGSAPFVPPTASVSDSRPTATILPGESLAKYKDRVAGPEQQATEQSEQEPEVVPANRPEGPEVAASMAETGGAESPAERDSAAEDERDLHAPELPADPVEPGQSLEVERVALETLASEISPAEESEAAQGLSASEPGPQEVNPAVEPPAAVEVQSIPESPSAEEATPSEPPAPVAAPDETPGLSPSLEAPATEPSSSPPAVPPEGEGIGASPKSGEAETNAKESAMPQEAAVREGHSNPRYMRKSRWVARKTPQTDTARRGGRPKKEQEAPRPLIADLLREGQEIIVQIAKEPLGKKGARITSHIALPGRYLVFMPTVGHVGVSRKIASEEERQRLKHIILENSKNIPGGFIVRTAGEGRSREDFRQDILYLSGLWAEIKGQAEKVPVPALLHHDLNLVLRTLRDQLSEEFSAVWVDNEREYEKILGLVSKFQPSLVPRVKLYTKDAPLFDELGIQEEINNALKPKVWLKSGGYIVINQTEALVAIDVNTGKFVGRSNRLEDTIVKTNMDAIWEIVRQIRLRDLGGIIVVDFIDMDERKNRQKVMAALEEALRADRAPSKILSFNEFGLVAITRKRVRQTLERTICHPCPYCTGSGLVKSVTTVCFEILSEARKIASQLERKQVTLRVNPEVGKALKSRGNTILQEIEEMTGKDIIVRNDASLHLESFDFD